MYEIRVSGKFSAAHCIEGYPGDCASLHGHNWVVDAVFSAKELDELGLACDFRKAKNFLRETLEELDHCMLNEHSWLEGINPTSENLARIIYHKLREILPAGINLNSVEVFESERSSVRYYPD